eukprot:TRINITY_DN9762_c0_g1_i1.p1 TRINITY_DN9762_c0_g1~~TRINITY_DN9762_c0_g1_i1.p1  ORF type:complete len:323 (+),score=42.93 TRINITY_DN9762_c0_g1_i1:380-1348(+)
MMKVPASVLLRMIESDVRRVRSDSPESQALGVRCASARILFYTAHKLRESTEESKRKDVSSYYRQSMAELLAPLLGVVVRDSLVLSRSPTLDAFSRVRDDRFVEADTFALFWQVLTPLLGTLWPQCGKEPTLEARCRHIEALLRDEDEQVATFLKNNSVDTSLFAVRCLTPLFAVTLSLDDVEKLWDCMFAANDHEPPTFEIAHCFAAAAVLQLRHRLLRADRYESLQLLTRFPALDVDDLILSAQQLHERSDSTVQSVLASSHTASLLSHSASDAALAALDQARRVLAADAAVSSETRSALVEQIAVVENALQSASRIVNK